MADCEDNNKPLTGSNPTQLKPVSPIINTDIKGITGGVGTGMSAMFNINNMISATNSYLAINHVVNQMFGYDVKWFRAIPQQRSKDVFFQEYTLSNVDECPLDIKVVLPGGTFPDSKYNYDLMGLEYEVPLEIQIDKKYWESIASFGTAPQKNDIVYFSMANKLYDVESAYLFRGFMEQETAWKLNLKKYQPKSSRHEGDVLKNTIDMYTVSTEEIFGGAINNDIKKLVDDQQFNQFNGTSKDKYKSIDSKLTTINTGINIYGTMVAQSFYDMNSPVWYNAITYNATDIINTSSDRSITAWIQPHTIDFKEYDVANITQVSFTTSTDTSIFVTYDSSLFTKANYSITLNTPISLTSINIDDNVVISRQGALNFYAKVVAITQNPLKLHCIVNAFVEESLYAIKTDWSSQKGYKMMIKEPINIIDGINVFGEHVLSINVYANQYVAISYGHTYAGDDAYVLMLDDKINDNEWYAIVANIGNSWQQYSLNVWKKHETDKNAKLQSVFSNTIRLYAEDIAVSQYTVNKSPSYLTNLRIYNTTIEEDKQVKELLSYFTADSDQIIIADEADPILLLPYISKQR